MPITNEKTHLIFKNLLNNLATKHPNEYADMDVIEAAINQESAAFELRNALPKFINTESCADDAPISTYGAIVDDAIKDVRRESDSIYSNEKEPDETPAQKYHNTNFYKMQMYGKLLATLSVENDKIEGQGLVDTTNGIANNLLTYQTVAQIVENTTND